MAGYMLKIYCANLAVFLLNQLLSTTAVTTGQNKSEEKMTGKLFGKFNQTMDEFLKDLFKNYDKRISPGLISGKTTRVKVGIFIHTISGINERDMDFTLNMFLRQIWNDSRLEFQEKVGPDHNSTLSLNAMRKKLWVPDLYFVNEKRGNFHTVTTPNLLIRLNKTGGLTFSQKLTVTFSCPMHLRKFPMDEQQCTVKMESYGYFREELVFEWKEIEPVEFSKDMELPEFYKPTYTHEDCTLTYATGSYSCLVLKLTLKRKFGYFLTQTYIPSILIVILSWVSFWIDVRSVPARISLGLLTVLSMTTQSAGARGELPRVSYIKAIDLWMSTCLIFVFGALIEYAVANVIARTPLDSNTSQKRKKPKSCKFSPYMYSRPNFHNSHCPPNGQMHEDLPICLCTQLSCYDVASTRYRQAFVRSNDNHPNDDKDSINPSFQANYVADGGHSILSERTDEMIVLQQEPLLFNEGRNNSSSPLNRNQKLEKTVKYSNSKTKPKPISHSQSSRCHEEEDAEHDGSSKNDALNERFAKAEFMDSVSRWAFPLAFCIFNLLYWTTYLCLMSNHFNTNHN